MINGTSTSPPLTQRGFKWFWRTTPHDKWFTKDLFELLKGLTEGKVRGVKAVPQKDLINLASACEKTEWGSNVSLMIESWAKFLRDLKSHKQGGRTLLDDTMVFLTSNLGNASSHDNRNVPALSI